MSLSPFHWQFGLSQVILAAAGAADVYTDERGRAALRVRVFGMLLSGMKMLRAQAPSVRQEVEVFKRGWSCVVCRAANHPSPA